MAGSFQCLHCGAWVALDPVFSGVQNRNHCPYCLWSRHLDLDTPGDRLSACKAPMQPVGLALKPSRQKYGPARGGELMLVHRCSQCDKLVFNRIAADDDVEGLLEVYARYDSDVEEAVVLACLLGRQPA
ncbi:MAG: RNHCP domain-containing protein [Chloroflexi bacterium]|nr:RNHCP domain-containing protein [Chloroflexota bacterium]